MIDCVITVVFKQDLRLPGTLIVNEHLVDLRFQLANQVSDGNTEVTFLQDLCPKSSLSRLELVIMVVTSRPDRNTEKNIIDVVVRGWAEKLLGKKKVDILYVFLDGNVEV